MRIEGLQAVRNESNQAPHVESLHSEFRAGSATDALRAEDVPLKKMKRLPDTLPNITSRRGCDFEVCLVERGHDVDTDFGVGNWLMDSFRVGVGEPVCMLHDRICLIILLLDFMMKVLLNKSTMS